jgi:glutathione synthase/RimK-type ligase-like ATP-grasp enzyme
LDIRGGKRTINNLAALAVASNKLSTFQKLKDVDGICIPTWTTDRSVAEQWINDGITVLSRTSLGGHSGAGIHLCDKDHPLVAAPLYVQYIKKQKEFRVHVAFGEVIDVQEKRKRKDVPEDFATNYQVRNHHTGWVYCRENIQEPDGLRNMAVQSVAQLGLDFGAVDLIWNEKRNEVYVLEINTAPGLEGQTVEKYAKVFWDKLK